MNANRVKVFHRADCKNVSAVVAYNFKFNFLPARNTFFYKNLVNRRTVKSVVCNFVKFFFCIGNTAASTTQRKCRTDNCRQPDSILHEIIGIFVSSYNFRRNTRFADCFHCILEHLAVFRLVDCFRLSTQKLNVVFF